MKYRTTLLVVMCLGGCAALTDMATPEPGRPLDGVREEVGHYARGAAPGLPPPGTALGLPIPPSLLFQATEVIR
jgi:hypothetical protein